MMAPMQLPCPVGDCDHKTIQLEYAQAKEQLDIHVKYTHAAVGGESSKKPAQFPRPEIKLDRSSEDWYEFQSYLGAVQGGIWSPGLNIDSPVVCLLLR